ncbi:MAG: NAD-dependent epimerase/dehydratase family protein [Treponema sp.]|nr:NAD-dependent epimerase/dehydratase family protein [Treponema sp.]
MKKILLTGATGMIGSAIVREALMQKYEIACLVRANSARIANIPQNPAVHIIECNITDYETLKLSEKFDIFIHLAWNKTSVGGRDDVDCQLKNIKYTLDAVRLAKRCGCSVFIGAGSQAEYGVQKVPLTPDLPVQPESGYGIAKYTAGKLSAMLCRQLGLRFNWMRILSVYGPNDGENTLISYVIREFKAGRSPELTKCEQTWDYLHCDDAARAFLAVAEHGVDGKFYPLGSGKGRKLSEYVADIQKSVAPNVPVKFGVKDYYPHQPMYLVADVNELERDTRWKCKVEFPSNLE